MESVTVGASLNEVVPDEFLVPHTTSAKVLTDTLQVPTGIKHPTSRLVEKSQETGLFCFSPPESIIHEVNGSFIQKCLSLPTVSLLRLHQESYSPGSDESLWLLPVNSDVICNYSIPAGEAVSNITQLPCDEEPCVHWVTHRSVYLDLSETVVAGSTKDEGEDFRYAGRIEMVTDHNGNIIYQWYDHKGHLHSLSEQEYKLRLALYFQSVLEVLYPEYFGAVLPAGGGWHRWDSIGKWKVRQVPYNKASDQKKGVERNSKRRRADSDLGGFHREGDNRKQQKIIHIDDQPQLRPRKKISVEDFFSKKVAKVDESQEVADQLFRQCKRGGKLQETGRLMVLIAAGHLSQNHSFIWVAPVDAIAKMAFSLVKMKSDDLDSQKLITLKEFQL